VRFDSLLAKVIAHANTRVTAIRLLAQALSLCEVVGVTTNRAFLLSVLAHPLFLENGHTTAFLEEHRSELVPTIGEPGEEIWLAAAVALVVPDTDAAHSDVPQHGTAASKPDGIANLWGEILGPWRHSAAGQRLTLDHRGSSKTLHLWHEHDGSWLADGAALRVSVDRDRTSTLRVTVDSAGTGQEISFIRDDASVFVVHEGQSHRFTRADPASSTRAFNATAAGSGTLRAPMPGLVVKRFVSSGDKVSPNQPIVALEAMKMEHIVQAPHAGVIRDLPATVGTIVPVGAVLAVIEPLGDPVESAE
jgi:acetyl/propionyl-CoA carboxylase alpha subunit